MNLSHATPCRPQPTSVAIHASPQDIEGAEQAQIQSVDPFLKESFIAKQLVQSGTAGLEGEQQHNEQPSSEWLGDAAAGGARQGLGGQTPLETAWTDKERLSYYLDTNKMLKDLHFSRLRRQSIAPGQLQCLPDQQFSSAASPFII